MTRWFNIAGPCYPDEHYMVPVERRAAGATRLIEEGRWFSLVSGRQTGKTTVTQHLAGALSSRGHGLVLWIDLETARGLEDPATAFAAILALLDPAVARDAPALPRPSAEEMALMLEVPSGALVAYLRAICGASDRPVVLLFDEADVLVGPAMISFLAQLRALYLSRKSQPAPRSVVLSGVRAIRDDVAGDDGRRRAAWLGTASPFNVTVEDVTLPAFTEAEVEELVRQHTVETGQRFDPGAVARIFELSAGHPWLVNALADQVTRRDVTERGIAITAEHVEAAKETIILERRTHLDSLLARLHEPRVRRVLEPMLVGGLWAASGLDDDVAYVAGLGLIRRVGGAWAIANPIYREVIPRALNATIQDSLPQRTAGYLTGDGQLDVPHLMEAWQAFWRKDGHLAAEGFTYRESGPHLMLMAFLQRIVNGGGRIDREYALGKGALDLLVTWTKQRVAIEVKLRRDSETEAEAIEQVAGYLDRLGLDEGWLVLFDLRASTTWEERLYTRTAAVGPRRIHVVGC